MDSKTVSILVVGLGSIGQRHARLLQSRSDVRLFLCDVDAHHRSETQAAFTSPVPEFEDFNHALRVRPDIVILCTPNHLHAPMGLAAIAAGCDVLVEKPIADNAVDGVRLVEAAEREGRALHVGYMLRFDPGLILLHQLLNEGEIGKICGARAMVGTYVTLLNSRCNDKEMHPYSLVLDYTHEIDYIRWLLGEPQRVQAMGTTVGSVEKRPQPNLFQMTLALESGALVQIHLDYVQYPQRRTLEVYGDRGTLTYDFMTGELYHLLRGKEQHSLRRELGPIAQRVDDLFRAEHSSVIQSRLKQSPPIVTGNDGLLTLRVAELAIDSAKHIDAR
ncbi:MAG TPA: Gfo/Idh/MocA family oxidoreductase [Opitutaceae bacterium]|nr:Gfo/Idh/MocA family oxidoreductase [Opitutaceae bacterium]